MLLYREARLQKDQVRFQAGRIAKEKEVVLVLVFIVERRGCRERDIE